MEHSRRILLFIALCLLLTLSACTMSQYPIGNPQEPYPAAEKPLSGAIRHLPTGIDVSAEQMLSALRETRIVYVGETHDNPAAHRLELQILKAMAEHHPGRLSLGMEMFNIDQQSVLDRWTAGELDERTFLKESAWHSNWRMDFDYYRDILLFAREHGIPVIGLNAPKKLVQTLGMQSIEDLDEATRSQLPAMDLTEPYQRAMVEAVYAGHGEGNKRLDGFHRVQTLWDEAMAESIVRELQAKEQEQHMVVIAGGNHVRYGFGIPRRVFRRLPTSYQTVGVQEVSVPPEKRDRLMDIELPIFPMVAYDYLAYVDYESLPGKRVKLGVRFRENDGRVVVESVVEGSTAGRAGILAGDILLRLGDAEIRDAFDLVYEVNQYLEGDNSILTLVRNAAEVVLPLTFEPMPEGSGHK